MRVTRCELVRSDHAALPARLSTIQDGARIAADPGGRIGCCLIAEAVFFNRDHWVAAPKDWSPRTQTGARFSLDTADGLRVWSACRVRLASSFTGVREATDRYGAPVLHSPRLGQGIFRVRVLDAYSRACAVTTEHSLPVLDAAHIRPFANGGEHSVANGLVLRSDLHRLFDRGYVTVDDEDRLVVGRRLKDDFDNGRTYYALHGRSITLPLDEALRPDRDALAWHRSHAFLG